jgi:hypothetical protein
VLVLSTDQNETRRIFSKAKCYGKKNEKFNMAWRLRGFIIYWLSKFRRLKGFPDLYYNAYPNLLYLSFFFLYEDWRTEDVRDLKIINRSKGVRNCNAARQLFQFYSLKKITAPDCFLSATIKIQPGNFKILSNSFWGPA